MGWHPHWGTSSGSPKAEATLGEPSVRDIAADDHRWLVARREIRTPDPGLGIGLGIEWVVALDDLRWLGDEGLRLAPKGRLEHLLHRVDKDELDRLADLVGDVDEVLLVLPWEDDDLRPREVGSEDLALQPADRQDPTAQRDLPRHRHVLSDRDAGPGTH